MAIAVGWTAGHTVAAGPPIDTSPDRANTPLNPGLKQIGTILPRSADAISGSNWTLGCETLDRDYADYQQYKEYLVPLGIKTIRLQGGWAKTEKVKGEYDFAWLDTIIDDARSRGLNILLETDYGNPIYEGGGGADLAGGFPTSEAALAAWDRWIEAPQRPVPLLASCSLEPVQRPCHTIETARKWT